jgi:hypothetical protein
MVTAQKRGVSSMKPSKPTYKQFSLTDLKILAHDKRYWSGVLSAALEAYGNTKVTSDDDRETKAIACATLAGLGLAIHNHFGTAVEALGSEGSRARLSAGLAAVDRGKSHTDKMENAALKQIS